MATSLDAKWRFVAAVDVDWDGVYAGRQGAMVKQFATVQSLALAADAVRRWARAVLEAYPDIVEVRLSAPNKHHFVYDLARFGLENAKRGLPRRRPALRPHPGDRHPRRRTTRRTGMGRLSGVAELKAVRSL